MRKIILLFFSCCFAVTAYSQIAPSGSSTSTNVDINYNRPKEYEIAEITVTGIQFLDPNSMISVSGLKVGDRITVPGDDISSAIRKIWALSLVGDVDIKATKIEGDKIWLNIHLTERARLAKFSFRGIRKGESDALTDKIKLIKGKIVTDALIKNTQLAVRKYFVDKGFMNTVVKVNQVRDTSLPGNSVTLIFNVDKKRKVKIHEIEFDGNSIFSDAKLHKKLKKTKEKKIYHIFTPSKYIATQYEEDKDKLAKFYSSNGYRDFRIISDTVFAHNSKTINIHLKIEEGKKYYYRNIYWEGNYLYSNEQLASILKIKKGDVYNVEELEKRLTFNPTGEDITSLYMDYGYLFFNIQPEEISVVNDSVDVLLHINEGEQATINKVTLAGNTQTSDYVVLRELRTIPGQKFSRRNILRTQQELGALQFFDPQKITPNIQPNQSDGTVDIEWQVEEKPSDQIQLSGGWGGAVGFVGTVGLTFNNFSSRKIFDRQAWRPVPKGDGQRLSLQVQANGKSFQNYSISFSEPWFGGKKPNTLSFSVSHSINSNNFGKTLQNYYARLGTSDGSYRALQITSFTVGLAKRLKVPDDFFSLSTSLSYLIYNNINQYSQTYYGTNFPSGVSHNVTFNATLSRSSISDFQYPRSGSSISLSATFTPPWTTLGVSSESSRLVEYHKWMFDSQWNISLIGKLVLHTRAHMGFIGRYRSDVGYTPFERFVLGGSGMVGMQGGGFLLGRDIIPLRGYDEQKVGPLNSSGNATGGIVYNKYVTELRYPVTTSQTATIYMLGFMEAGNNWGSYKEFNPFNLRRTVGVGARIFMPAFGLIGIDFGQGLDPIPGVSNNGLKTFIFSIGQQIR
ncbi:outer membrane protein assembly factor BamA [Cytophagaceae bacterium YF14B1]|uniref:Outer membrane protein assembly factor BamA n=1 Tax=Xanthocytophaga flava TaxID=3048013 RepID=A0AAE3QV86_9BACT|nr:outer membrane protein assembly factor BamA [Xanthocytophaga flavus]MDJ1483158.1 outer membrane protein assembly factor BamA [Xanthocytophaga flavus]